MKVNVVTLYEGHYHLGVASLINSLMACGFRGDVTIYYKDRLPPWCAALSKISEGIFSVQDCRMTFRQLRQLRHFGYHKPFAALTEFDADAACDAVVYADPDVLFLAPWRFLEEWISMGVALCLDTNFPYLSEHHPWRKVWGDLLTRATGTSPHDTTLYANSGFFGVKRGDAELLRLWVRITEQFEAEGGNTASFDPDRHRAIAGDQDLLAAALMGWPGKVSMIGQEGMGFNGHHFILAHHVETPKPWVRGHTREALKGSPPTSGSTLYLKFSNSPLAPYSRSQYLRQVLDFKLAKVISRVWSR